MTVSFPDHADVSLAAAAIRERTSVTPRIGLILGSGLGRIADAIADATIIPYTEILGFPVSGAPSHKGLLCVGTLSGVAVVLMQGRVHLYEGYTPQQVTFPVRVMQALGISSLLITNAAGAVNKAYQVGDLMAIEDHINLPGMCGLDPLRGQHIAEFGDRFTTLNSAYDAAYLDAVDSIAAAQKFQIHRGTYAFVAGPSFETPAEIRFLAMLGADAVGMSTAPEVLVARNAGIRVLAVSAITNMAIHELGSDAEDGIEEVWENIEIAIPKLSTLIREFLKVFTRV